MKESYLRFLRNSTPSCLGHLRCCDFRHRQNSLLQRILLLRESLRLRHRQTSESLSEALYTKPSKEIEQQISLLLRLPMKVVRALLGGNRLHNLRFERRRQLRQHPTSVREYCESFQILERTQYLELLRVDARSRIVASFHCGDFLYGGASLLNLESPSRRQFVLSLNRSSGACYSNLAAGFGSDGPSVESELLYGDASSAQLSQLLRAGNTTLALFCDLPPGLNESIELEFLNRPAWFSIGPAILALANRVPLLPMLNFSDGGKSYVKLGGQIEPQLAPSESLQEGARRVTQELLLHFESIFLKFPEQWRFLPLLPLYFRDPGPNRAESELH